MVRKDAERPRSLMGESGTPRGRARIPRRPAQAAKEPPRGSPPTPGAGVAAYSLKVGPVVAVDSHISGRVGQRSGAPC